ncbi:hypothetical protein [Salirhabdus sp. Marseille-P4669]|uniref:hypothetical protein n=1 Tax=Salirhabdus sp. Marseille-P4669 TaxID=2042310 RepID=UPI000C7E4D40|nr:hypothetical protein [Salirhabdus sp. Marseille-P4669]
MICPSCHTEQHSNKFCNTCGENLQTVQQAQSKDRENTQENNERIEQKTTNLVNKQKKKEKNKPPIQFTWNLDNVTLAKGVGIPVGSLVVFVLLSAILAPLLNGSRVIKDYIFLFFTSTLQLGEQVAISLLSTMKLTMFDVLLAMHGGTMKGTVWEDGGRDPLTEFTFQFPVILAIIATITLLAVAFYFLKRFIKATPMQKLAIVGISALIYSFVLILVLQIMKPTYVSNEHALEVSFSGFGVLVKAFLIVCMAGLIGFGPWKLKDSEKGKWFTVLQPLKTFFITLLFLEAFICILMIVTWLFTNPATLMAQPISSPGTMWFIYRNDPLFYLLLPNIVLAEQLYAIGGTWQITTPLLGELIQVSNPFSINILTGSNAIGMENAASWTDGVNSARFVWHPFALLIAFIYAATKLPQNVPVMTKVYHGVGVAAVVTLLANWLTISFKNRSTEGIAGFNAFQVFLCAAIVIGLVYVAYVYLPNVISKKRVGEET